MDDFMIKNGSDTIISDTSDDSIEENNYNIENATIEVLNKRDQNNDGTTE